MTRTQRIYNLMFGAAESFKAENTRAARKMALSLSDDLEVVADRIDDATSRSLNIEEDLGSTVEAMEEAMRFLSELLSEAESLYSDLESFKDEAEKASNEYSELADELGINPSDNPNYERATAGQLQAQNSINTLEQLIQRVQNFK